jgi:tetratricopeptide (TPR) repeat protein
VPDAEDRRFVEPRLAQLLGLGGFEARDRQDMFAAWRLFFERLAETNPTVLVFEDLQWADASLLDFVEYLLEWSRNHPLFVVTLARPELLERRPTWGAGRRSVTSTYLEPLSQAAMEELLEGLVPGLPEALCARILERAEGVPLYAVETVRMLLDRGLLVRDGSVYRLAGEIEALEVPETLHALVAARLDGLRADERRLLQDAAVLGKTFRMEGLAALAGLSPAELEPVLASLVRKEVLAVQADPRSPEHGQYGFLQDLVRRVAYDTLSRRDRRARHLAAADYLGTAFGEEEAAEVVASHLLDAYREVPGASDAEEVKARAGEALVRAGERAEQLAAPGEAQRYYEQATELTDDSHERARLAHRAGSTAWRAGNMVAASEKLEQAQVGYLALGDERAAALVASRLADVDFETGHVQTAVGRLEPAFEALRRGDADSDIAVLAAQLGRFLYFTGEMERAAPHVELALDLAEALDLPETLSEALNSKALLLMTGGRMYEARVLMEGALSLALANDLHAAALRAYNNLNVIVGETDAFGELEALDQARLELARRVGDRRWESIIVSGSVGALVHLGRWDEAVERVEEARTIAETSFALTNTHTIVHVYCGRGQLDEARRLLEESTAVVDPDSIQDAVRHAIVKAEVLRLEGRPGEALEAAREALTGARSIGATSWAMKASLLQALEASVAAGDLDATRELLQPLSEYRPGELTPYLRALLARFRARLDGPGAERNFATAEGLLDELGFVFELALTKLEHAEWLVSRRRGGEAGSLLAEARGVFERLGARPLLARLAAAEAGLPAGVTV